MNCYVAVQNYLARCEDKNIKVEIKDHLKEWF
jgi:hypothetical protein